MAADSSTGSVVLALVGNGSITVLKFFAYWVSGSGAMLSEAIHSLADTSNQALLYLGIQRSQKQPDEDFPYGYGQARFFWGLVSAMGIFFLGAGVTLYHGVSGFLHPHEAEVTALTWWVLAVSFLVEGGVLYGAWLALKAEKEREAPDMPLKAFVSEQADPVLLAVLTEDSVAVLGVLAAVCGILMAEHTGDPRWDAAASLVIGTLLGLVAVFLAAQNRRVLIDTAIPDEDEAIAREVLEAHPMVDQVHDFKSVLFTFRKYKIKAELDIDATWVAKRVNEHDITATGALKVALALKVLAMEVNHLEAAIKERIPEVQHIDLEINDSVLRPAKWDIDTGGRTGSVPVPEPDPEAAATGEEL